MERTCDFLHDNYVNIKKRMIENVGPLSIRFRDVFYINTVVYLSKDSWSTEVARECLPNMQPHAIPIPTHPSKEMNYVMK